MPRIARAVLPGFPYHVTHRGNRRTLVFHDDVERRRYLEIFLEVQPEAALRVWAYCLMPNHVHWVLVPDRSDSMAEGIGRVHRRYAAWLNHRHGWKGHLWAHRYFSTALDDRHLWFAARYVELNPVRAGMLRNPLDYPWSSARANVRGELNPLLDPIRPMVKASAEWADWLRAADPETGEIERAIRANTLTGRPTGSAGFVRTMESALGRSLATKGRGRPPARSLGTPLLPGLHRTERK
ncbi:MAG TPA: transposase [Candidatus Polarisedimenticolaceae bacterium]